MSTQINPSHSKNYVAAVVRSALWAAAGDALGWITELSNGVGTVRARTGHEYVTAPVSWFRHIGGKFGPKVALPAGIYSDDTQLRLSVGRAIRGDGFFDVEAFAKIELTVWQTYALGAGRGTKAAASNLAKRNVAWFSNFYEKGGQRYLNGGGNGAAMRVQPHVWSFAKSDRRDLIRTVFRDAIVTHGHPQGIIGALFHALILAETFANDSVPGPHVWREIVSLLASVPTLIGEDEQLSDFWLPAWEARAGKSFISAFLAELDIAAMDVDTAAEIIEGGGEVIDVYRGVLSALDCISPEFRGAGFKTALAAAAYSIISASVDVHEALVVLANELDTDTDTIATMVGAQLGVVTSIEPDWEIVDRPYIVSEAQRLARIATGLNEKSFNYPDLGRWNPPESQSAALGICDNSIVIRGLGVLRPTSEVLSTSAGSWQWFVLPFGQTILAKRGTSMRTNVPADQMPGEALEVEKSLRQRSDRQHSLSLEDTGSGLAESISLKPAREIVEDVPKSHNDWLSAATDEAISSQFDEKTLGRLLNACMDRGVTDAVAFVAIVAKAKLYRMRKRGV